MSDSLTASCPTPVRRVGLRAGERLELALVVLAVAGVGLVASGRTWELPLGHLVCYAAALLLAQGLVRDLARLVVRRLRPPPAPDARLRLMCLCAESSLGSTLVVVGILLTLAGEGLPYAVSAPHLAAGVAVVLVVGFVAKDWVLVLRRVEDHATIDIGR